MRGTTSLCTAAIFLVLIGEVHPQSEKDPSRFTKELNLSEEQVSYFLPALQDYQARLSSLRQQRRILIENLKSGMSQESDSNQVRGYINGLNYLATQEVQLRSELFAKAEHALTVEQLAKLVLQQESGPGMNRLNEEQMGKFKDRRSKRREQ